MRPKDWIDKKTKEAALKAFSATQLNNNQETSPYFIGKISADRTKITDSSNGKVYNLKFTGNPREYELAQRLSNDTAVVNAAGAKPIQVDGGKKEPIMITGDNFPFTTRNSQLWYKSQVVDLNPYFDSFSVKSLESIATEKGIVLNQIFSQQQSFAKLSKNGHHLLLVKLSNVTGSAVTGGGSVFMTYSAALVNQGITCGTNPSGGSCSLYVNTPFTENLNYFTSQGGTFFVCSYKIYKNFSIDKEGNITSSEIELVENDEYLQSSELLDSGDSYGTYVPNSNTYSFIKSDQVGTTVSYTNWGVYSIYFDIIDGKVELYFIGDALVWNLRSVYTYTDVASVINSGDLCLTQVPPFQELANCSDFGPLPSHDVIISPFPTQYTMNFYSNCLFFKPYKTNQNQMLKSLNYRQSRSSINPAIPFLQFPMYNTPYLNPNIPSPRFNFLWFCPVINENYGITLGYRSVHETSSPIYSTIIGPNSSSNELDTLFPGSVEPSIVIGTPAYINDSDRFYSFEDLKIGDLGMVVYYKNNTYLGWCPDMLNLTESEVPYRVVLFSVSTDDLGQVKTKELYSVNSVFDLPSSRKIVDFTLR